MSDKDHNRESSEESRKQKREERREKDHDILAKEEPTVLETNWSNPEFPAMSEFEVDEGGAPGSKKKHPGLPWFIIAIVAVVVLVVVLMLTGNWFTPTQAEQEAQQQFNEEIVPEDMGAN